MIAAKINTPAYFALPQKQPPRLASQPAGQDTIQFGRARYDKATYTPQLEPGTYGIPKNHPAYEYFPLSNRPGVVKVQSIKSLDPFESNPAKAYSCEIIIDLKGTLLDGKTTPGEHLGFFDISDPQKFPQSFRERLRQQGDNCRFSEEELQQIGETRIKKFTIASPSGGELGPDGKPNGTVKLIVRRVEKQDGTKGPMTNFLVNLKPGDGLVLAAPIAHHFLGPKAGTPAIFLGIGTSVSPYVAMVRNRFEVEKGPYADTYLGIGHTIPEFEYEAERFRKFAQNPDNHFTYRPVFSQEPQASNGIKRIQPWIQQKEEARKVLGLLMKDEEPLLKKLVNCLWPTSSKNSTPKTHIYVSGFFGFGAQMIDAFKKAARLNPDLGYTEKQVETAINKAIDEKRWHEEGDIREDLMEGSQGY